MTTRSNIRLATQARDMRTMVVKLLRAHHLHYLNMWVEKDPQTGVNVTLLKFRTKQNHSPKAFFDALNEIGIQYKRVNKDPEATVVVCELWPKGQKRRITELREKNKGNGKTMTESGTEGNNNGNLPYVGIPNENQSNLLTAIVSELRDSGLDVEADELVTIASGMRWDEFRRKATQAFISMKLYQRPEIRQLRETIATSILDFLGKDASLLEGMKGSDLDKEIRECIVDNIDLVLDTREIANSVIRRVSSTSKSASTRRLALLNNASRNLVDVRNMAPPSNEGRRVAQKVDLYLKQIEADVEDIAMSKEGNRFDLSSPLMDVLADKSAAYLYVLGELL